MKKYLLFSITIISLFSVFYFRTIKVNALSYNKDVQNSIKISVKEIKSSSDFIEIDLKIPVISGLKDTKSETAINKNFETKIINFKNELEKQAKEYYEQTKKQKLPFNNFQATADFKVNYCDKDLLSLTITIYQYSGGAHGMSVNESYNIDIKTGKILTLKDLFKPDSNYKELIINDIIKHISSNKENYFQSAIETIKNFNDSQPFYITQDNLIVYYGLYDIAPYAAGISEFKISFTILKDALKPEFLSR